jgi:hypothetical protein
MAMSDFLAFIARDVVWIIVGAIVVALLLAA